MIIVEYENGNIKNSSAESGAELYFYIKQADCNCIFNKITDRLSGKACYPDMLINTGLTEQEITDSDLYEKALTMQKKYGTGHAFFLGAADPAPIEEFIRRADQLYLRQSVIDISPEQFEAICAKLMLTETMKHSFKQLIRYQLCEGTMTADELYTQLRGEYEFPVSTKNEGKKIYELIRKRFLE